MELNIDQIRVVNSKPNGHILIKGVAGSGKTTVAVSKIPVLINHFMNEHDGILFVTYNKTLIKYTQFLLKDVQKNLYFEFNMDKQLQIKTIDSIISSYGGKLKPYRKIADNVQLKNNLLQAIGSVKKNYPQTALISEEYYSFLNEEIDWLKSCNYTERETYLNVDRIGRMSVGENRYRLYKNSTERSAIFDVFLCYEQIMEKKGLIDYKTNALRVLNAFRTGKLVPTSYRHVIVDESQDLTRVQLEIIKYFYRSQEKNSSIMFIADAAQSIYPQSWLSGQSFKSIGFDMSGKSNILSKNYRTTYEIAQAAYSLIEKDDTIKQNDIFVKPVAIERHGNAPYYKHYETNNQEAHGIANHIKQLVSKYELKDIVIVAVNYVYLEQIQGILLKEGIPAEIFSKSDINFEEQIIRMYTLHSVKGLEFPVLFIAGINDGVLPYSKEQISIGRRLLYVGMTRAKQELYLSSAVKQSVYMREMDAKLLRDATTEFSPLYKVDISKYVFQNRVQDIYSREEVVRQWFIQELMTKRQYPLSDIEIEYPVQMFSKRGYVDVIVFRHENGRKIPYIMAEIKQPGEDMDRAMKELRCYASCCPLTEYLVITDGTMMHIENIRNRQYVPVKNIPMYKEQACNLYEEYEYVNWNTKRHFSYGINLEDREEIILKDGKTNEVIECGGFQTVDIVGQVAAGVLKYANEEYIGNFRLPDIFGVIRNDVFLLQVKGDSMIHFEIYDGDYVLIKKQEYAQNGDIVVAGKRGENQVTLKQYCNYGKMIGLMPGNAKYAPIMIMEDELFINGVLLGVLRASKNH